MFNFLVKRFLGEVEFAKEVIIKEIDGIRIVFGCEKNIIQLYKFIFLCNTVKSLPSKIKETVKKEGGLIRLDDLKDSDKKVLAFFRPEDRAIFIRWNTSNAIIKSSLYHEIGHLYDVLLSKNENILYRSIEDTNFHNIAVKEGEYYGVESYYMSNIREYFAESFCRFHLKENFHKECPKTYSMMNNYLAEI